MGNLAHEADRYSGNWRDVMDATPLVLGLIIAFGVFAESGEAQWVQQNSGTTERLTDVTMLDSQSAIAVGRNRSILTTFDGGKSWFNATAHLSYTEPWFRISSCGGDVIVVGDNGGVLMSTNSGGNWMWRSVPVPGNCLSALCVGSGRMYVGSDSGWVCKTSDGGATWNSFRISKWPIRDLFWYRGPTIWGSPTYALTPYSLCTESSFAVPAWSESILTQFQGLGSEANAGEYSDGGGPGFIVGVQGDFRAAPTILKRPLSDSVWHRVGYGILRDGVFLGVAAPSAEVVYVCGSGGMVFKTTDGGQNWLDQSWKTNRTLNAISFVDERHGVAVGDSGLILWTSNGGTTSVEDRGTNAPTAFVLEQNYPNPFNPSTTIRFALSVRSHITLTVINLLGQLVADLVHSEVDAGHHEVKFDGSGLSTGCYVYRLQAGSHTVARKLVIVR